MEESTLSSEVLGNGRKYAFFESFWEWKKVRSLRKFLGVGRKYAFFESFWEWKKVRFLRKFFRGWKKVRFLRKFLGVGGFGRKYAFF
jgi:hypothetical protein